MKVSGIAYYEFMGIPLIIWGGGFTLLMFAFTAAIGFLNSRGVRVIKFKYHKPMAYLSLLLGFMHGLLGMLSSMGY